MTAQETSQLAQELYKELVGNAPADVWDWQALANKAFIAAENFAIVAQSRAQSTNPTPSWWTTDQIKAAQAQSQMNSPADTPIQTQMPGPVVAATVTSGRTYPPRR